MTPREDAGAARRPSLGTRWVGATIAAIFALGLVGAFVAGAGFYRSIRPTLLDLSGETSTARAIPVLAAASRNLALAWTRPPELERITIDIAFKNLAKLREKRSEALETGILLASDADQVPATIRGDGRSIRVKIRLKGDGTDHLLGDKWSLRVHVRKDDHLFGMRRFSIQAPPTRAFQAEPVVLEHLRREGVLAPRYLFVDVTVNGEHIGLMAIEEHFSKELLESQERLEGVMLRFDEDAFWRSRALNGTFGPYGNPRTTTIRPFRSASVADSSKLSFDRALATGLLRGFLDGALPAASVFHVERTARFLAVAEVWKARHLLAWHNLRFYFDPVTARFEPIGFDASLQTPGQGAGLISRNEGLARELLEDPELRAAFLRNLRRIAGEMADGSLQRWVREFERPLLRVLHREYPTLRPLNLAGLASRARSLARIEEANFAHYEPYLGSPDMLHPSPVRAYSYPAADPAFQVLELVNVLPVSVTVTSLRFRDPVARPLALEPGDALPLELSPTPNKEAPTPLRLRLRASEQLPPPEIEGIAVVAGQGRAQTFVAQPYFPPLPQHPAATGSVRELLARHDFLQEDPSTRGLRVREGEWTVAGSLVLPDGVALSLGPGTVLRFAPGEALIASGPLHLAGSPERPVIFEGLPGDEKTWAGVVIRGASEPFEWRNAIFRNTAGIERGSWKVDAGVTVADAQLAISATRFEGNRSEDALHLVNVQFRLEDVHFRDTASDAFDADFSDGSVTGGRFSAIGGDAIDLSGAEARVEDVEIEDVRDKALSVGEGSRATARRLRIRRVGTAAASKDSSTLVFEDSEVAEVGFAAVAAYVKKPEFGGAEARVDGVRMDGTTAPVVAQKGSHILLDGTQVEPVDIDVDRLYEEGPMRK